MMLDSHVLVAPLISVCKLRAGGYNLELILHC